LSMICAIAFDPGLADDQQGTATALLAGLIGALKVIGKQIGPIRIAMIGIQQR
jgi:malate dehydrogenase (oxaloacetate-decarboxylating)